jgi:hypothetical protein
MSACRSRRRPWRSGAPAYTDYGGDVFSHLNEHGKEALMGGDDGAQQCGGIRLSGFENAATAAALLGHDGSAAMASGVKKARRG